MKTIGSKDLKKRKQRKFYAGKPIKKKRLVNGKLVLYKSKRKKTDPLKIWFFEKTPMSLDGYKRWSRNLRPHIKREVWRNVDSPIVVDPSNLSSLKLIEQIAIDVIQYPGVFQLRMPTHRKNRGHVSFCKKADVKIVETMEGLKAKITNYQNLKRYWFARDL